MPGRGEFSLLRSQISRGIGVFALDDFEVYSSVASSLGNHPSRGEVVTNFFAQPPPEAIGRTSAGTAGNAPIFVNMWKAVRDRGTWQKHNWTIKADPDCVVIPDRLKGFTMSLGSVGPKFVENCNRYFDLPTMFGALEVFSHDAMQVYLDRFSECDWIVNGGIGEDEYMDHCLGKQLHAEPIFDLRLLGDARCFGSDCNDDSKVAFHDFKQPEEWLNCWKVATKGDSDRTDVVK